MIYAWNDEARRQRGGTMGPVPCKVFDASSKEHRYVCWCDTETGWIEFIKTRDQDGKLIAWRVFGVIHLFEQFPAPLRIVTPEEKDGAI